MNVFTVEANSSNPDRLPLGAAAPGAAAPGAAAPGAAAPGVAAPGVAVLDGVAVAADTAPLDLSVDVHAARSKAPRPRPPALRILRR